MGSRVLRHPSDFTQPKSLGAVYPERANLVVGFGRASITSSDLGTKPATTLNPF
jgi:hypothetical protein